MIKRGKCRLLLTVTATPPLLHSSFYADKLTDVLLVDGVLPTNTRPPFLHQHTNNTHKKNTKSQTILHHSVILY